MPFTARWMGLEFIKLSEISQETKTKIICCHLHVEFLKNDTNELIYETKIDLTDLENKCIMVIREEGLGEG